MCSRVEKINRSNGWDYLKYNIMKYKDSIIENNEKETDDEYVKAWAEATKKRYATGKPFIFSTDRK